MPRPGAVGVGCAGAVLHIAALSQRQMADADAVDELVDSKFLLERPAAGSARVSQQGVLLIDPINRAPDEFEAFLLEVLSNLQISVLQIGTVRPQARR